MLGNANLLALPKTALLSSRRVPPAAVMRCYDWATEARDAGRCVASGFQSALERDVLSFLLRGTSPIVLVLARSLWKSVPKEFREKSFISCRKSECIHRTIKSKYIIVLLCFIKSFFTIAKEF